LSTLYIRHPSRTVAENVGAGMEPVCLFALVADDNTIAQQGSLPLSKMSETAAQAGQTVLLLAASDVTLLRMKVPKLSASRLKAALPNLVEDQLIADPEESVIVAGASDSQGMRTIAIVQRTWLNSLARTLQGIGARKLSAVPSQLCLPYQPGRVSAAAETHENALELALRLSEHEGVGLPIRVDPPQPAAESAIQSIRVISRELPVTLYVQDSELNSYRQAADSGMTVAEDIWANWIEGAKASPVNLMSGLAGMAAPAFNWKAWRWPLALAAAVVIVNIAGLYVDWWQLNREANALNTSMVETYRSVFPQETVIVDPVAQMSQKLATARRNAGQIADDDFIALTAALGDSLNKVAQAQKTQGAPGIAALEYHERSLTVRWKGEAPPLGDIRSSLAARNLALTQPSPGLWQIKSAK